MSTSTQLHLANRRTAVRMGRVWSVDDHAACKYPAAAACPTFALQFAMFEGSKRVQSNPGRVSNA
jgi:hypothetical protein